MLCVSGQKEVKAYKYERKKPISVPENQTGRSAELGRAVESSSNTSVQRRLKK